MKKRINMMGTKKAAALDHDFTMDWKPLYDEAENWQSELEFMDDELRFFRLLMDKYFIWFSDAPKQEKTNWINDRLRALDKKKAALQSKLMDHFKMMSIQFQQHASEPSLSIKERHLELKVFLDDFKRECRVLKLELFRFTEQSKAYIKGNPLLGKSTG